jgi:hypothetical protein
MAGLIAKFASSNEVFLSVFAAVHSRLQMFCGAAEPIEQSDGEMITLRKRRRISIPHRKVAVEA